MTADVDRPPVADAELTDRFRRDPDEFTAVYDRYFRDVYRYAVGRLDVQTGEDIAAETFGHESRVVTSLAAQRLQPQLLAALTGLNQRERDVVLLIALGQLSHGEVAQTLGIADGTAPAVDPLRRWGAQEGSWAASRHAARHRSGDRGDRGAADVPC
ncbi:MULTISPECIES: RNA polymerase sigma factor [unclassified Spirillospora]|uniref:RNA polymerase sigma factor n=1 Tax=unclassified Spirillospora TaxID=2642701 RepID=UPI0037130D61